MSDRLSKCVSLVALFLILNAADALLAISLLEIGGIEINPIMASTNNWIQLKMATVVVV